MCGLLAQQSRGIQYPEECFRPKIIFFVFCLSPVMHVSVTTVYVCVVTWVLFSPL